MGNSNEASNGKNIVSVEKTVKEPIEQYYMGNGQHLSGKFMGKCMLVPS
jgi:hypothetical protein